MGAVATPGVGWGILIALALAALLLVPFLYKEIRRGKRDLGPTVPTGTGDARPGRRGDPAPGQPDAQADPYGPRAQRGGPPIKS
ncbi:MAG: hypothetical protein IT176_11375 [Acidobacteria bacterium]|nr:hypothetical protein [Acidobacteriota bacterium]